MLLLTVPTLVSIAVQEGSNQFNQGVGNAAGGQKQWDDDGEDSPSPTGVCTHTCASLCVRMRACVCVYVYMYMCGFHCVLMILCHLSIGWSQNIWICC